MIFNRIVRRSWGWYWTILDRKHFKVKLLRFWKGRKCSLQRHEKRNELWLILRGEGFLTGATTSCPGAKLISGDWGAVKTGDYHDFWSMRKPSLILEIQYGEKCVEEDIVRIS